MALGIVSFYGELRKLDDLPLVSDNLSGTTNKIVAFAYPYLLILLRVDVVHSFELIAFEPNVFSVSSHNDLTQTCDHGYGDVYYSPDQKKMRNLLQL